MRVRCLSKIATPDQAERYGGTYKVIREYDLTPGKEYVVVALTAGVGDSAYGRGVHIEALDDSGRWSSNPLFLFDLVDPRPSRYWIAKKVGAAELALAPESFFRDSYHDGLTDGVPEIVADFKRVSALLMAEFASPQEFVGILIERYGALWRLFDSLKQEHGDKVPPQIFLEDLVYWLIARLTKGGSRDGLLLEILSFLEDVFTHGDAQVKQLLALSFLQRLLDSGQSGSELRSLIGPAMSEELQKRQCSPAR